MNDIGANSQAFINILFAQLYGFRFICLLQPRTLTIVDDKVITSSFITHFITTQLSLKDELGKIHTKILDLFPIKQVQYPIILGLPWLKKHLPHIWFDKNIVTFNSPHCVQHYLPFYQALTVSGLDTAFDHPPSLLALSDQAVNVSSADDFAPDPCFPLLSYYRCRLRPLLHQAVNISSIDKSTDRHSRSMSSSTSSPTPIGANTPRSHNSCPRYSYNSYYRYDMADSLKTMNQELS